MKNQTLAVLALLTVACGGSTLAGVASPGIIVGDEPDEPAGGGPIDEGPPRTILWPVPPEEIGRARPAPPHVVTVTHVRVEGDDGTAWALHLDRCERDGADVDCSGAWARLASLP